MERYSKDWTGAGGAWGQQSWWQSGWGWWAPATNEWRSTGDGEGAAEVHPASQSELAAEVHPASQSELAAGKNSGRSAERGAGTAKPRRQPRQGRPVSTAATEGGHAAATEAPSAVPLKGKPA